jgi:hypothetical protein
LGSGKNVDNIEIDACCFGVDLKRRSRRCGSDPDIAVGIDSDALRAVGANYKRLVVYWTKPSPVSAGEVGVSLPQPSGEWHEF